MQIEPFGDETPLNGEDAPKADQIDDLLRILATIRKRWGNTAVRYRVRWGASALWCHDEQKQEIERLQQWVADLQSGMYINCVYCGHRYGPKEEVPATMADVLKAHIATCPKHPVSKLLAAAKAALADFQMVNGHLVPLGVHPFTATPAMLELAIMSVEGPSANGTEAEEGQS